MAQSPNNRAKKGVLVPVMNPNDVAFGAKAVELGLLSVTQVAEALHELWCGQDSPEALWQVLVVRGVLDVEQCERVSQLLAGSDRADEAVHSPGAAFLPTPELRYTFEKRLGAGGMGVVRQMKDKALGRSVAMKQLHSENAMQDELVGALLAEARAAGMLEHPNIIPVYDAGIRPTGEAYYTMRLVDRMSLKDVLDLLRSQNPEAERQYPLVSLLRIFQSACLAVDYAHSRGVLHRDLKPDNIRIGRYGEVQVADWGLARVDGLPDLPLRRALREAADRGDNNPCIVVGSPNYMSPEQAMGKNDEIGPASDIYGLGCILYEILTLHAPHEHVDTQVLLEMVEVEPVVPPRERSPGRYIPQILEEVCLGALERDPLNRVQDTRVLWKAVEDYVSGHLERERLGAQAAQELVRGHRFANAYWRKREARVRLTLKGESLSKVSQTAERRALDREVRLLDLDIVTTWAEAYDAYGRALAYDPSDKTARAKVAELSWVRLADAEAQGDELGCHLFFNFLRRHNDGAYDRYVTGTAVLTVESNVPEAEVTLYSTTLEGHENTPLPPEVGKTPWVLGNVPAGLYLVLVEAEGFRPQSRPVFLYAGRERTVLIELELA